MLFYRKIRNIEDNGERKWAVEKRGNRGHTDRYRIFRGKNIHRTSHRKNRSGSKHEKMREKFAVQNLHPLKKHWRLQIRWILQKSIRL